MPDTDTLPTWVTPIAAVPAVGKRLNVLPRPSILILVGRFAATIGKFVAEVAVALIPTNQATLDTTVTLVLLIFPVVTAVAVTNVCV